MRILTIVGDLGLGGTQRVAQNYTLGYQSLGCETAVLAIDAGGSREEDLSKAGIPVFIGSETQTLRSEAVQQAKQWKPDILHIHRRGFSESKTGAILRQLKTSENRVLETNVFSRVDYSSDRDLIDVHLHLSRWCLWKWSQWSKHLKPKPIGAIIPNIVECSAFVRPSQAQRTMFRNQYNIPEDAFVFGRIGQKSPPKWSPIIFDAFAEVVKKYPHVYLLLVGLPDELKIKLKSLSSLIQKQIIEIPIIQGDEKLCECYGAIDIFLHASAIGESFGMVLVEAMLCKCPVITLSTPDKDNSQLEVVGHNRGGLVVSNRKAMISAMVNLIEDSILRKKLGDGGGDWVKYNYDLSSVMPKLIKVARIALESSNRQEIKQKLLSTPELILEVQNSEIHQLLTNSLGKPSVKQQLLMNLVSNPWIYQCYSQRFS